MARKTFTVAPSMRNVRSMIPALLLASATAMVAQTNTTGLSGVITDPAGATVPGATVSLTNGATGLAKTVTTESKGEYSFDQIPPGEYLVSITGQGFAQQVQKVQLLVATPVKLNFKLTVGNVEVVNVEATSAQVNTTDATLGKAFDSGQVSNLPYIANNTLSLLALQPGVLSFSPSGPGGQQDPRAGTINGARQDQTNITLDGVDNNEMNFAYAFGGTLRATRDSVQEFRVTTSNANADAGRSSGAQVSLVTKSGTNSFHGGAYEYYRSPALSANDWFNKQSELNVGKPDSAVKILQHTYGASLGMPLIKNKLFFFGAYEGYKQRSGSLVNLTVPLASYKAGNITYVNTSGGTTTITPSQIAAIDKGCSAAAAVSTIGGGCPNGPGVNANVTAYMASFPTSNASGGDGGYNTAAYSFVSPAPIDLVTNIARFDYNITSRQIAFVRGNLQSDNTLSAETYPGGPANTSDYGNTRGLAAGHIWTINDHLTNNFRYGWVRYGDNSQGAITGPYITFGEFSLKTPTSTSTRYLQDINNFADDFTIVKGRHTITVGVNNRLIYNIQSNTANVYNHATIQQTHLASNAVAGGGGSLDPSVYGVVASSFSTSYAQAAVNLTGVETWGYEVYNFKVANGGLVAIPNGTIPVRDYHSLEQEYYGMDQFKITPKLTLTAGLRWSYLGVPWEINGQEVAPAIPFETWFGNRVAGMNSGVPYNTREQIVPAGKGNGAPSWWTAQKLNFAPTFAFAYAPDNKTAIRGGFRLAYDHFGTAVVNSFNANGSYGLSGTSQNGPNASIDTNPRYVSQSSQTYLGVVPTPPTGGAFPTQNPDAAGAEYFSIDSKLKTPYAEVYNFTLQRELHKGLSVTATYTGRLGRHLLVNLDAAMPNNLYDPASGTNYFAATTVLDKLADQGVKPYNVANIPYWQDEFANATYAYTDPTTKQAYALKGTQAIAAATIANRGNESNTIYKYDYNGQGANGVNNRYFHPQFAALIAQTSQANSNYQGLQLSLRHTLGRNFTYDVNYTYAKSMDMGSSPERSNGNLINNSIGVHQMYAVSDFDTRHLITADWVTAIPYGHGQRWGASANRVMDEVLGGWQVTGVAKFNTALPFSPVDNHGWPTTWEAQNWMVKTGAPISNPGHHTALAPVTSTTPGYVENAFGNRSALPTCTSNCTAMAFREPYLGETGARNGLRADGYFSLDPGLSKSFRTYREQTFRITIEAFNVLNAVRFTSPTTTAFGTTFGQYSSIFPSMQRQMQIAGRYNF